MSKKINSLSNNVPQTINAKIFEILSEAILEKATAYIRKYETETDALLFKQGLNSIKNMLFTANQLAQYATQNEFCLIKEELELRINEVDSIIVKLRGKRPVPLFSENDKKIYLEIEQALRIFFGANDTLSFKEITPLLLEASTEKRI